ncbi:MAG: hypothetical protein MJ222_05075 [Bacilli bacterium]|nr:hypothetical protein [Bacilli bacterium]
MAFIKKKQEQKKLVRNTNGRFVPYEETKNLLGLKLFISIVPLGQASGIVKILENVGVNYNIITQGEGTGAKFVPNLVNDNKKQIVFSFVREDMTELVKKVLKERFSVSKASNGISFSVKLTSVMGVSIYKFLSNTRKVSGK